MVGGDGNRTADRSLLRAATVVIADLELSLPRTGARAARETTAFAT